MRVRSAILSDATTIELLIAAHVSDGTLLPRSLAEICENIRDFMVVESEGEVIGCGALHSYGPHLAEIRSVTVKGGHRSRGAGTLLVEALMDEARRQQVPCICLFTRIPDFFAQLGFRTVEREALPDKAYKDCQLCPRQHACDEVPMVQGELPNFAIPDPLPSQAGPLFRIGSR